MAYKKLLYNDNCILDEESNLVIFDFNDEWDDYVQWKKHNPNESSKITKDRDGLLRWNQGVAIKKGSTETKYHINGNIYKKILYRNSIRLELEYNENGNIYKKTLYRNSIRLESKKYNENSKLPYLKKYFKNNKLNKKIRYYPASRQIATIKTKISESEFLFKDYYDTGVLRATGNLDINNKMIGEWSFFSRSGIIESTHYLDNGKLVKESTMYTQTGNVRDIIKHD